MNKRHILYIFAFCLLMQSNCMFFKSGSNSQRERDANLMLLLLLAQQSQGCPVGNGAFWTIDFRTGGDLCMNVTLRASGDSVLIYEENNIRQIRQSNDIADPNYREILREVEEIMIPRLQPMMGSPTDVNRDGKITIVFTNMSTYFTGGSFIAGYFSPLDLFQAVPGLASNQREIIFIDAVLLAAMSERSLKRGKPSDILSTIAHEYQHLVRFPWEIGRQNATSPFTLPRTFAELRVLLDTDSLWINEGTSELASDVAGYGPQESRLSCLRGDPAYGCLNQLNGKSLYRFRNAIIDYSLSYAWMSHIYHNSDTTEAGRNDWIRKTIQGGFNQKRGKNISELIELYQAEAPKHQTTDLGSTLQSIHGNLTSTFLGGLFQYRSTDDVVTRIGLSATEQDISDTGNNLLTNYSIPTQLRSVFEQPSLVNHINNNPIRFELTSGQIYRVLGDPSSGSPFSPNENIHIVHKKGSGPEEYAIFNGSLKEDPTEGFAIITKNSFDNKFAISEEESLDELIHKFSIDRKPILNLPSQQLETGIHANEYIQRLNAWKIFNILKSQ